MSTPEAFFTQVGADYLPHRELTRGPWGEILGGQVVGGLLGWALDRSGAPELQPARFTVDLLRPVFLKPIQVSTTVQRSGRRIKLVDATLHQDGQMVARASGLFLRRGEHPAGEVYSTAAHMPPPPCSLDGMPEGMPFHLWSYGTDPEAGTAGLAPSVWQQAPAPKYAWVQVPRPIVAGHPLTPFSRVAFIGDVTSSLTHWSTEGLRYINADYTVALARLPVGEFIGLAAQNHHSAEGVAAGAATLFDSQGPIGTSVALALAQPPEAFRPPHVVN